MNRLFDTHGFTLIELVVVVAIIGVLVAIAIPVSSSYIKKARVTTAIADIEMINKAIALLETDTEQWPGHQTIGEINNGGGNEIWDLGVASSGLLATDGNFPNWDGPYLPSIPKDPWGNDYFLDTDYRISGTDYPVVGSFGPNGLGKNVYDADDVIKIIH